MNKKLQNQISIIIKFEMSAIKKRLKEKKNQQLTKKVYVQDQPKSFFLRYNAYAYETSKIFQTTDILALAAPAGSLRLNTLITTSLTDICLSIVVWEEN